jgi:RNA polymerase sigma-70 factor (ECF subfamily)
MGSIRLSGIMHYAGRPRTDAAKLLISAMSQIRFAAFMPDCGARGSAADCRAAGHQTCYDMARVARRGVALCTAARLVELRGSSSNCSEGKMMSDISVTPSVIGAPCAPPEVPVSDGLAALLGRIAAGEECALALLYELTVARLFSLARLIVRDTRDAEEVVCDTFIQVWRNARQYDPQRGSVLAWLLTICRSRAVDRVRRNRTALGGNSDLAPGTATDRYELGPEGVLQLFKQDSAVFRTLAKLSPLRRRLIALAFFRGLTHEEIAKETELPVGTVKSHIRRALAAMRSELDDRGNGARLG